MNKKIILSAVLVIAIIVVISIIYSTGENTIEEENPTQINEEEVQVTNNTEPELPEENITEETNQETGPQIHTVEMLDFEFSPEDIIIKKGDTVTWVNKGKGPHYVLTSSGLRILDSKNIKAGESWSYTFEEIGFHKYFSPIYTRMAGTVSVQE